MVSILEREVDAKKMILKAALERGWRVLDAGLTDDSVPNDSSPRFAIVSRGPDEPFCRNLIAQGVHIVRRGVWSHPMDNVIPAVLADREVEGRMAAEHYAERGFRSVGFIHFVHLRSPLESAFREHAKKLGCRYFELDLASIPIPSELPPDERFRKQRDAFIAWLSDVPRPIGLLLRSDTQAARICRFCLLENIAVPDEVALLGRGNIETICDFTQIRLSSIELDDETRIATCFEILDAMNAGRKVPQKPVLIPPKGIVTRESTDVRSSQNREVAKVLRYMWDHYDDLQLSVNVIADMIGFSRRKLERLFRAEIQQTVNGTLLSRRMERCCELLITTDVNISEIHQKIGLRSREHFHRAFKQFYGITPQEFRKKHRDLP